MNVCRFSPDILRKVRNGAADNGIRGSWHEREAPAAPLTMVSGIPQEHGRIVYPPEKAQRDQREWAREDGCGQVIGTHDDCALRVQQACAAE